MALGEVALLILACAAVAPLIGIPRVIARSKRKVRSRRSPVIATLTSLVMVAIIGLTLGRGYVVTPTQVGALVLNVVWLALVIRANAAAKAAEARDPVGPAV
jgi:hypothetical protein